MLSLLECGYGTIVHVAHTVHRGLCFQHPPTTGSRSTRHATSSRHQTRSQSSTTRLPLEILTASRHLVTDGANRRQLWVRGPDELRVDANAVNGRAHAEQRELRTCVGRSDARRDSRQPRHCRVTSSVRVEWRDRGRGRTLRFATHEIGSRFASPDRQWRSRGSPSAARLRTAMLTTNSSASPLAAAGPDRVASDSNMACTARTAARR